VEHHFYPHSVDIELCCLDVVSSRRKECRNDHGMARVVIVVVTVIASFAIFGTTWIPNRQDIFGVPPVLNFREVLSSIALRLAIRDKI
jgi:hypothetical protein